MQSLGLKVLKVWVLLERRGARLVAADAMEATEREVITVVMEENSKDQQMDKFVGFRHQII